MPRSSSSPEPIAPADELPPPRREDVFGLDDGRQLGLAEYGPPGGRPVFWFHGTPGGRLQIAPDARSLSEERGIRILAVERPGMGASTPHRYRSVLEWARDIESLADALGVGRFAVTGLSGGGPYALACAHAMPERVVAAAILSGVAPSTGPDAVDGGWVAFGRWLGPLLERTHRPLGLGLRSAVRLLEPLAHEVTDLFGQILAPGDRRLLGDPITREMFHQDLLRGGRTAMQALFLDLALFGRPWGFALREVRVPVRLWYGDADNIVPLAHGQHLAKQLPDASLRVRPGDGHLCGLGAADEIFEAILELWDRAPGP